MNVEILEEDLEVGPMGVVDQEGTVLIQPVSGPCGVVGLELTIQSTVINCSSDARWVFVGESVV